MNPLKGKYDIGVIVGRWQVHELTEAHRKLIATIKESHRQYILVVGVSPTLGTKKHPLGYTPRMQMLTSMFPDAIITYLVDNNSDEVWSNNLDFLIRALCPLGSVCLYGGRNSFIQQYTGKYPTFELSIISQEQGTQIREDLGKESINSEEFRRGIIYACQNQYPKTFPTVDIAVIKRDSKNLVLLGRRKEKEEFRFPGGFVDPSDESLEDAALRELGEELDVSVHPATIRYLGSTIIEDWRYTSPDEKIMTALFAVDYLSGGGFIKDEFVECEWFELNDKSLTYIEPNHQLLFNKVLDHVKRRKGSK